MRLGSRCRKPLTSRPAGIRKNTEERGSFVNLTGLRIWSEWSFRYENKNVWACAQHIERSVRAIAAGPCGIRCTCR